MASKLKTYWELLQDIQPGLLETAMRELARESIWFPTVAEIREAAMQERQRRIQRKQELLRREDYGQLEAVKEARFLGSGDPEGDVERRRAEFREMLKDAGLSA